MFGGVFLQGQMSSKHQIAHSLNDRHRHVDRSIRRVSVSQGNHDGQRSMFGGDGGKGSWKDEIH